MKKISHAQDDSIEPRTVSALRRWLSQNHTRTTGLWLILQKKSATTTNVRKLALTYSEAVDELLCFGWIDSKAGTIDDSRSKVWISPRKAKSGWSKVNKDKIAALEAAGRLAEPGIAKVSAAKLDGTWSKLDQVEALEVPKDLEDALASYPQATEYFDAFPRSIKRAILEWIMLAKRPETRAKRVSETASLAAKNIRARG